MAQNKRQHWVPQFYLRYFATEDTRDSKNPQVWATPVEVETGPEFKVNVQRIAAKSFLYSPPLDDGTRDDRVDLKLQGLESLMAEAWPRLANEHVAIDGSMRKILSLFIATLLLRNPEAEDWNRKAHRAIVDAIEAGPMDTHGNPIGNRLIINGKETTFDPSRWKEYRDATEEDHQRQFVANIVHMGKELAEVLLARRPWWVCYSKEPVFATSDHPIACWNEANKLPGLGRPDTLIYFPFSPTRMLVIGDKSRGDCTVNPLFKGGEGFFNQFIYRAAKRWLFTPTHPSVLFNNMLPHLAVLTGKADESALDGILFTGQT